MRVKSACELSVPLSKSGDKEDGNETIGSRRAREGARKSSSRSKEKQQQKGSSSSRREGGLHPGGIRDSRPPDTLSQNTEEQFSKKWTPLEQNQWFFFQGPVFFILS